MIGRHPPVLVLGYSEAEMLMRKPGAAAIQAIIAIHGQREYPVELSGIALAHFVLGPQYVEAFRAKMAPTSDVGIVIEHVGLRIWFGILCVFVYAGFRPRLGRGPRTAVIAGATVFLGAGLVSVVTLNNLGLLTGRRLWAASGWTLVETTLAEIVGAWIYREPS